MREPYDHRRGARHAVGQPALVVRVVPGPAPSERPRAHHMRTPRMGLSCSHTLGRAARGRAIARPSACTIFGKASLALVTERVDPSNEKRRPES